MKKQILILLAATTFIVCSCTTDSKDNLKLFPIKSGDKWGYVDKKGQYVINSQFEEAYNFSEGLAMFKSTDGKYGFIDETGNYFINPIYKDASSFSEGMACVVMENGKPQFIDKNNKILFTVDKAESCFGFKDGLARVKIKGKWGFIDNTGKVVVNPIYDEAQDFKDGLAAVSKKDEKKDEILWGYIDKNGAVKINFQFVKDKNNWYCDPGSFSNGLAFTSTDGNQWGCIDKEGKYQINPQFEGNSRAEFKNGVSLVSQGGSYGFIDNKGKYVINPQFKNARHFSSNNLAAVQHSDDKWGFINKEGKYEVNPQFEEIAVGFFGDIAFVKSSDKYGIIDKKGLYIVNPQFDDVKLYDIGLNFEVKSDFIDNNELASLFFEKASSTSCFGYDKKTSLEQVIDEYPDIDISDLNKYDVDIKNPNIKISDLVKIGSLTIGFNDKTYTETPIYKTVQKYDYYYNRYYNTKEFVKMEKKIQTTAAVKYTSLDFTLQTTGKKKGEAFAEALKNNAIKTMKLSAITNEDVKNSDSKGVHILKGDEMLVYITYKQDIADENSKPMIVIIIVNKNYGESFDELAEKFIGDFKELG